MGMRHGTRQDVIRNATSSYKIPPSIPKTLNVPPNDDINSPSVAVASSFFIKVILIIFKLYERIVEHKFHSSLPKKEGA